MTRDRSTSDGVPTALNAAYYALRASFGLVVTDQPSDDGQRYLLTPESGIADMASVGRFALANPDLVEHLKTGAPLNEPDPKRPTAAASTVTSTIPCSRGGEHGYIDYPVLAPVAAGN